jgi:hypothetical protein
MDVGDVSNSLGDEAIITARLIHCLIDFGYVVSQVT